MSLIFRAFLLFAFVLLWCAERVCSEEVAHKVGQEKCIQLWSPSCCLLLSCASDFLTLL